MDPLDKLGIKLYLLIAGFAGGIVAGSLRQPRDGDRWHNRVIDTVISAIVGSLMSVYLAPFAIHWWNLPTSDISIQTGIGFLFGITGMVVASGIMKYAHQWARNPHIGNKP